MADGGLEVPLLQSQLNLSPCELSLWTPFPSVWPNQDYRVESWGKPNYWSYFLCVPDTKEFLEDVDVQEPLWGIIGCEWYQMCQDQSAKKATWWHSGGPSQRETETEIGKERSWTAWGMSLLISGVLWVLTRFVGVYASQCFDSRKFWRGVIYLCDRGEAIFVLWTGFVRSLNDIIILSW